MISRKTYLAAALSHRQFMTSCCLHKGSQLKKQVHMMKKIISGGLDKGKRRFVFNENLPKTENVKKLGDSTGQGKESHRRITVLNKLFMKNITDLMATDRFAKNISGYGIQVTMVKISPDFQSINVFWLSSHDENDYGVAEILKSIAGPVRHHLSQLRLMGEVPRIYFVRDRHFSKAAEVDNLLAKADFGDDFVPTDPTLFMKSRLELQIKLPDDVRERIYKVENEIEDDETAEEELPLMRNDVMGIDHTSIMKRIAINIDKTKRAWETFETRSETILASSSPTRDIASVQLLLDKKNKEASVREEFVKFLERKQNTRRDTPERKKHKNLFLQDADEHIEEQYRDASEGDYLEDDDEDKK